MPFLLPRTRCALTAPFHPYSAFALAGYGATGLLGLAAPKQLSLRRRGGLLSVALSLGSPPPDVIRHRISMEPGLSSPPAENAGTGGAAIRPADRANKGFGALGVKRLLALLRARAARNRCQLVTAF